MGVGPQPLPRNNLTIAGLATAISDATNNPGYATQAKAIRDRIMAEEGTKQAIRIIQQEMERNFIN
jgi:hypothetical protein